MSLAVAVYVPEGIVMASDSRLSLTIEGRKPTGEEFKVETVSSDEVNKTYLIKQPDIGISHFGQDYLADIPMSRHIRNFIEEEIISSDDVGTIPEKLVKYFKKSFPDADVGFHIAGYKKEGKTSIPHIYYCQVGRAVVQRRNITPDGSLDYGATWSGEIDVITSIVNPVTMKDKNGKEKIVRPPVAPILWDKMTVQDAIDFAIYAIRTTIDTMRFQARPKSVGGPIDVLLLTPDSEPRWIQQKGFHGERA